MTTSIKIDFVSDISCPWCVIGLRSLETALSHVADVAAANLHFQPFELNPQMSSQGEDANEHIAAKYGSNAEQVARTQEMIRARGAELGFEFNFRKRERIYNTFDAHRLLHWADGTGKQKDLKHALFAAYFTEGRNPSDRQVLEDVAAQAGLDTNRVHQILVSNEFANEVRAREQWYLSRGINAVPAVILNDRYLVQGGQPVETFEGVLRKIVEESSARQPA